MDEARRSPASTSRMEEVIDRRLCCFLVLKWRWLVQEWRFVYKKRVEKEGGE